MTDAHDNLAHLPDAQLAAFLDDRLSDTQRERVLMHLAQCTTCRRDMTAAHRAIASSRATWPKSWQRSLGVVAAAALIVAIVPRFFDASRPAAERAVPTGAQPDLMARIAVVAPLDRDILADAPITFAWRSAGADATYRVALQDGTGRLLWETTIGDTVVAIPKGLVLEKGQPYFWSVDARLADGRSAASGPQGFSVR